MAVLQSLDPHGAAQPLDQPVGMDEEEQGKGKREGGGGGFSKWNVVEAYPSPDDKVMRWS